MYHDPHLSLASINKTQQVSSFLLNVAQCCTYLQVQTLEIMLLSLSQTARPHILISIDSGYLLISDYPDYRMHQRLHTYFCDLSGFDWLHCGIHSQTVAHS